MNICVNSIEKGTTFTPSTITEKMKQLHISKTEKNISWVNENLVEADYKILAGIIVIFYQHDFQKVDILNAIAA